MNDLVRVCILLASHTPVSAIIRGHLSQPASGKVGDVLDLAVDQGIVSIGMRADIYVAGQIAVSTVVEDLSETSVRVKVIESESETYALPANSKARFWRDPRR